MNELLPCPFCGKQPSKPHIICHSTESEYDPDSSWVQETPTTAYRKMRTVREWDNWFIECCQHSHHITAYGESEEEVIAAWNRRV